jgi:hypothetical protein
LGAPRRLVDLLLIWIREYQVMAEV